MNPRVLLLVGLFPLALALSPKLASPQGPEAACPERHGWGAHVVFRALSQERLAWFRRKYGLTDVRPEDLRRLTEQRSSSVCERLNAYYAKSIFGTPRFKRSYYRAGEFYFAAFVDTQSPAAGRRIESHFALFDSELRLRATLAPKRVTPIRRPAP